MDTKVTGHPYQKHNRQSRLNRKENPKFLQTIAFEVNRKGTKISEIFPLQGDSDTGQAFYRVENSDHESDKRQRK